MLHNIIIRGNKCIINKEKKNYNTEREKICLKKFLQAALGEISSCSLIRISHNNNKRYHCANVKINCIKMLFVCFCKKKNETIIKKKNKKVFVQCNAKWRKIDFVFLLRFISIFLSLISISISIHLNVSYGLMVANNNKDCS